MKKILFLILLFSGIAFSQVALTSRDSITTLATTDITPWMTNDGGTFKWRQMSWRILRGQISDYMDGLNLTWTGINTFNGATFNSGSHGVVTFADSVLGTNRQWFSYLNPYDATSFIGDYSNPFLRIYSKNFVLVSTAGSDSAYITYDGTEVSVDKPLSVSNLTVESNFTMDSSANFATFNFEQNQFTIPNVGDTTLTLTTSDLYSSTELDLPGNVTPGISFLQIDTAPVGMILRFYNGDASYSIIFKDAVSGDDNMYMEGDFTMGQYDNIEFECIDATKGAQKWIEVRRKNN